MTGAVCLFSKDHQWHGPGSEARFGDKVGARSLWDHIQGQDQQLLHVLLKALRLAKFGSASGSSRHCQCLPALIHPRGLCLPLVLDGAPLMHCFCLCTYSDSVYKMNFSWLSLCLTNSMCHFIFFGGESVNFVQHT